MKRIPLLILVWTSLASLAVGQFFNGEISINGSERAGQSVALSGQVAAVLSSSGIYLFAPAPTWATPSLLAILTTSDGSAIQQVAAANKGTTIVGVSSTGGFVFVEGVGGWADATETAQLLPSSDWTGVLPSIAVNGSTVVMASQQSGGVADLYVQPGEEWPSSMSPSAELTPSDNPQQSDYEFGYAIAVFGVKVAISAPLANQGCGAIYVYQESLGGWQSMTQTAELSAGSRSSEGCSGSLMGPLAMYAGTIAAAGSGLLNGSAPIFTEPPTGWQDTSIPSATLTIPHYIYFRGITSLAIDSTTIILADSGPVNQWQVQQGSAFVCYEAAGGWASGTPDLRLVPKPPQTNAGASVAVQDGKVLLGAPGTDSGQGAVFVYTAKHP
jgi:hypothetical protein